MPNYMNEPVAELKKPSYDPNKKVPSTTEEPLISDMELTRILEAPEN